LSERGARILLAVLAVAGLLMSLYLTWVHLLGVSPVRLTGSGGCEAAQTSRYAEILGVPVATLEMGGYAGCSWQRCSGARAGCSSACSWPSSAPSSASTSRG
jgi:uncharacterized membrane protein